MKPRQTRHNVKISARMRHQAAAGEAAILNASARGLLLHAPAPPPRGSYIELNAGGHVIVGLVAWARDDRFGVRTQDHVPSELVPELVRANAAVRILPGKPPAAVQFDRSRLYARALQFGALVLFAVAASSLLFEGVQHAFARPLAAVRIALGG